MIITKPLIEKIEAMIAKEGIVSFMLLIPADDEGHMTGIVHEVRSSEVINLHINFLIKAIDQELANNPDYDKKYAKIFTDFKQSFKESVASVNAKVGEYNKKHKPKEE